MLRLAEWRSAVNPKWVSACLDGRLTPAGRRAYRCTVANRAKDTTQFSIRGERSILERADRLLEPDRFEQLPPLAQRLFISRGAVLRECVMRGLSAFEADLGLEPYRPTAPGARAGKAKARKR